MCIDFILIKKCIDSPKFIKVSLQIESNDKVVLAKKFAPPIKKIIKKPVGRSKENKKCLPFEFEATINALFDK